MGQTLLAEATGIPKAESKGIWRVRLIEGDVHGSTGYYPASVLERDGATAFPRGTHVYMDHPTMMEDMDRPERSVRDLAGALIEDAAYEDGPDGKGLFGRVQFFPDSRDQIAAMSEFVGMSIRAIGVMDESPVTGDIVVQEIVEGLSVDVVTHAGAGGKLVAMTESARQGTGAASQQPNNTNAAIFSLAESDKEGMNKLAGLMSQLQETVTGLNTRLTEMENKAKQAKQESEEPTALGYGELIAKLDESELPKVSRERLARNYTAGDDFDAAIAEEKKLVDELKGGDGSGGDDGGIIWENNQPGGGVQSQGQTPAALQQTQQNQSGAQPQQNQGTLHESNASGADDLMKAMGWA